MLVEEAGQVLEAHILGALVPSIQHVVLIGDPQQLRPTINNYGEIPIVRSTVAETYLEHSAVCRAQERRKDLQVRHVAHGTFVDFGLPHVTDQRSRVLLPLHRDDRHGVAESLARGSPGAGV